MYFDFFLLFMITCHRSVATSCVCVCALLFLLFSCRVYTVFIANIDKVEHTPRLSIVCWYCHFFIIIPLTSNDCHIAPMTAYIRGWLMIDFIYRLHWLEDLRHKFQSVPRYAPCLFGVYDFCAIYFYRIVCRHHTGFYHTAKCRKYINK